MYVPPIHDGDSDLSGVANINIDLDSSLALNSTFETMSATAAAVKIMNSWSTDND